MFAHPCGLALTPEGTVFVADCGNHRIRQISPDGEVSTLAGSGQAGYKDGHGRHALFYNPCGIAIDYVSNDVLFVSDYSNNCVRAVSRSGLVSTLARDVPTPETALDSPYGIAVHIESLPSGGTEATVYVSSYHSHSLATISPEGRVSVLAGCGAPRQADGQGMDAAFHAPNGLSVDAEGNLFVADSGNHCLRRVTPGGEVTTIAGDGCPSLTPSGLNSPCGLCVCSMPGRGPVLLVADRSNSCIRQLPVDALPPQLLTPSTMREDLSSLLDCTDDVVGEATFDVQGRLLRAPKALLCARCPHFRAMVRRRWLQTLSYLPLLSLLSPLSSLTSFSPLSSPASLPLFSPLSSLSLLSPSRLSPHLLSPSLSFSLASFSLLLSRLLLSPTIHHDSNTHSTSPTSCALPRSVFLGHAREPSRRVRLRARRQLRGLPRTPRLPPVRRALRRAVLRCRARADDARQCLWRHPPRAALRAQAREPPRRQECRRRRALREPHRRVPPAACC